MTKEYSGAQIRKRILALAKTSENGLTTYGELWKTLTEGRKWQGNHSINVLGALLDEAICYCVAKKLPIVTTAVTRKDGSLKDGVEEGVYGRCRELGMVTGVDADKFFYSQRDHVQASLAMRMAS